MPAIPTPAFQYRGMGPKKVIDKYFLKIYRVFRTYSANIFINPSPACRETENGGEGERDTGTTSGKGVTRRVAPGYLLHLLTGQVERCRGESPPPPNILTPFGQFEAAAADLEDGL